MDDHRCRAATFSEGLRGLIRCVLRRGARKNSRHTGGGEIVGRGDLDTQPWPLIPNSTLNPNLEHVIDHPPGLHLYIRDMETFLGAVISLSLGTRDPLASLSRGHTGSGSCL